MDALFGSTGRLLHVDLAARSVSMKSSREYLTGFIGGRLLASRLYWDMVMPGTGALDPENVLMLMPGAGQM